MKDYEGFEKHIVTEMALLETGFGRLDHPVEGEPAAILVFLEDEAVVNAMLPLPDAKKLVKGLLEALVDFGDPDAVNGMKAMWPDK